MFLLASGEGSKDLEALEAGVRQILTKSEARIIDSRKWDERKLAYPIGKHKRANYLLAHFEAPPEALDKIRREASLAEDIIRLLILRDEKLEKELKKKEDQPQTKEEEKSEEALAPSSSSEEKGEEEKKTLGAEQGGDSG
jgi:small subunit ribosomal protein S6